MMDRATKIHIGLSSALALVSVPALYFRWSGLISAMVLVAVNVYLAAMIYEAIHRSASKRQIKNDILLRKPPYLFGFPSKVWAGFLILLLLFASISGFANLYLESEEIVYIGPTVSSLAAGDEITFSTSPSVMETKIEALYFSLVTMITLGYGDFIPVTTEARLLVMWQLVTSGLLAIGIFPLFIARAADF